MENNRSEGCPGWRLTAKILGWLWVAIGVIGFVYLVCTGKVTPTYILTFGFDMATAALWLYGLANDEIKTMLVSLIFSGVQTAFCLLHLLIVAASISSVSAHDSEEKVVLDWILVALGIAAVLIVIDFSLAIICYKKIKHDLERSTNSYAKTTYAAANKC